MTNQPAAPPTLTPERLIAVGGQEWRRDDQHRIFFNLAQIGHLSAAARSDPNPLPNLAAVNYNVKNGRWGWRDIDEYLAPKVVGEIVTAALAVENPEKIATIVRAKSVARRINQAVRSTRYQCDECGAEWVGRRICPRCGETDMIRHGG